MNAKKTASSADIQKLASLIEGIKFAMVTSIGADNHLQSCPLLTQDVDFGGELWFIIGKKSDLYNNIRKIGRAHV